MLFINIDTYQMAIVVLVHDTKKRNRPSNLLRRLTKLQPI